MPPQRRMGVFRRTGGFETRPYITQHNHPMYMVRHNHKSIRRNMRIMNRQIIPNCLYFPTELVHLHLTPDYITKQARLAVGAYRHEIRPGLRIIVPLQAKALAMGHVCVVVHGSLYGRVGRFVRAGLKPAPTARHINNFPSTGGTVGFTFMACFNENNSNTTPLIICEMHHRSPLRAERAVTAHPMGERLGFKREVDRAAVATAFVWRHSHLAQPRSHNITPTH